MRKLSFDPTNFKRFYKSIRFKVMASFIAMILLSLCSIAYSSVFFINHFVENFAADQTLQTLEQIKKNIEFRMKDIENVSNGIYMDYEAQKSIRKYRSSEELILNYADYKNLTDMIYRHYYSDPNIHSISFITDKGINFYAGETNQLLLIDVQKEKWYSKVCDLQGRGLWLETAPNEALFSFEKLTLTHVRLLKDFSTNKRMGLLIINVRFKMLQDVLEEDQDTSPSSFYIVNTDGRILYARDKKLITQYIEHPTLMAAVTRKSKGHFIDNAKRNKKLLSYVTLEKVPWSLVQILPMNLLNQEIIKISRIILYISLANLMIVILLEIKFSQMYLGPLRKLSEFMRNVRHQSQIGQIVTVTGDDEVAEIGRSFNQMQIQMSQLVNDIYLEQKHKKHAEIKALQAQINPHFLYNTLNSVNCMAKLNGQEDISKMVIALSNLLRLSIGNPKELITISEELDHLKSYLSIQHIRYRNKFEVELDIEKDVINFKTIKLILQPIVENALKHNLKHIAYKLVIRITVFKAYEAIIFNIDDNGTGMSEKEINELNTRLSKSYFSEDDSEKIGILNVHERIQLHFGISYGIKVSSSSTGGLVVTLKLPQLEGVDTVDQIDDCR